jgi:UDP-glucose 4-epimerase
MKVLVIGAGGYLGTNVVDRLLLHGHDVVGATRGCSHRVCELIPLHTIEASDRSKFFGLVGSVKPEAIVNCAGLASTPGSLQDPCKNMADNFYTSFNCLEAARVFGLHRVVLASSNVVYGAKTPYRAAKLAMEEMAHAYMSSYGLSVKCLRYGNIFGDGCKRGFVAAAVKAWRNGIRLELSGSRENTRHFVHIDDAAEATAVAVEAVGFRGWTDVCPDRATSLGQIIEYLPGLEVVHVAEQPGDVPHLSQGHSYLLDQWTDVREWLCGLSS